MESFEIHNILTCSGVEVPDDSIGSSLHCKHDTFSVYMEGKYMSLRLSALYASRSPELVMCVGRAESSPQCQAIASGLSHPYTFAQVK